MPPPINTDEDATVDVINICDGVLRDLPFMLKPDRCLILSPSKLDQSRVVSALSGLGCCACSYTSYDLCRLRSDNACKLVAFHSKELNEVVRIDSNAVDLCLVDQAQKFTLAEWAKITSHFTHAKIVFCTTRVPPKCASIGKLFLMVSV